ncbi:MAG: hypothetical protein KF789_00825 [Bdellovibrionaceae bacterium]|nr:hypothetical protein [Pseudobdellovibrionaceae bacterium]
MKLVTLALASLAFINPAFGLEMSSEFIPAHEMKAPMVLCENGLVSARLYVLPNEKEAEMIIEGNAFPKQFASHQIVLPMYTTDGNQVFLSEQSALLLYENGENLEAVLNMQANQPGIGQVLKCETFYRTLPVPRELAVQ